MSFNKSLKENNNSNRSRNRSSNEKSDKNSNKSCDESSKNSNKNREDTKKEVNLKNVSFRETIKSNIWGFKQWSSRYPMMFITATISQIVGALSPYVGIYLSALIINELAGERRSERLVRLVIITLLASLFINLLQAILKRWANYHSAGQYYKRCKIYSDKMLSMDFHTLDEQHTHDLRSQIMQNEKWQGWGLSNLCWMYNHLIQSIFMIIGAIALTVSLFSLPVPEQESGFLILNSPWFILIIGSIMLGASLLAPMCSAKASMYWTKQTEESKMGNRFFSFYGFMGKEHERALDIRIYRQDKVCYHYWKSNKTFSPEAQVVKYARGPMGALFALGGIISVVFSGIVYVFVCAKAWAGAFGIGSVTQYIAAITQLDSGIGLLVSTYGRMKTNAFFLRNAKEYLDMPNEMYQGSLTTEKRNDKKYEVEFRDVSFKYPASDTYSLRHVSTKFHIGERMAVVGQNGSGKTTFIKLLCRLYDPTEGSILLNGIDIRKYKYEDYLSIFAVVFQDFKLLALPLGENVAAGKVYDEKLVETCLKEANFGKRLAEMPEGLHTYINRGFDEKGVEISGGEAQKIALARALYKNAPFIILDEPTAALDPVAEYEVYKSFNNIIHDKTAVYISHRLSSCRFCDEILVFDEGQIVQRGAHDILVKENGGKYQELWNAQAQYYTETA